MSSTHFEGADRAADHGITEEADQPIHPRPDDNDTLAADTLRAARALAVAELNPGDAVHDAGCLQQMLAFVIEQLDARTPIQTTQEAQHV